MNLDVLSTTENLKRRASWLTTRCTPRKLANVALAGLEFAAKREAMLAWPLVLKIDISPLCNLRCTVCVHATPHGNPALEQQEFSADQRMSVEQFERIVAEVKGATSAISLYYFGDPLMHPRLDELCRVAYAGRVNTHVKTNFSFSLSDAKLERLLRSGLTHLRVCVDGITQPNYELTRVGGKIDLVLSNLARACAMKRELRLEHPRIEAQFIKFQHNVHELEPAKTLLKKFGVDDFTSFWGDLRNYTDDRFDPDSRPPPRSNRSIPQCHWPHFTMLIRYNGDVIPCANFRIGEQNNPTGDRRVIGNVFSTSVRDVWNSPGYRAIRRLVSNPTRLGEERALTNTFCHGCTAIFHVEGESHQGNAEELQFQQMYSLEKGVPLRRVVQSARSLSQEPADR